MVDTFNKLSVYYRKNIIIIESVLLKEAYTCGQNLWFTKYVCLTFSEMDQTYAIYLSQKKTQ